MISGSVDEIMLEPSNTDNEEDENGHRRDSLEPPREGEPDDINNGQYLVVVISKAVMGAEKWHRVLAL